MTTYKAALDAFYTALGTAGWVLSSPGLKVRHATSPDGLTRLWFKPQALWISRLHPDPASVPRQPWDSPVPTRHTLAIALSLHVDVRSIPLDRLVEYAMRLADATTRRKDGQL